jgi:ABC-2 type transport system permease protein
MPADPGAEALGRPTAIRIPVDHTVDHERVPDVPLADAAGNTGLLEVFRRHYVLRLLVTREVKARYSGSFLGLFWSYVQPAIRFAMYFFVIGGILGLHDNVQNFGIHMFAGLVAVHFFTESFSAGTRSIVRNKTIVRKMALPREMFPVASMLVSLFHVIPGVVILTVACVGIGWSPDATGFGAGLLALAIVATLGTALALVFSAANVFFRDFSSVVSTLTTFVTFSVPMIYPYSMVAERFGSAAQFYLLNPLAEAVLLMQRCFWVGTTSDPSETIATNMPDNLFEIGWAHLGGAIIVLALAQLTFSKLENKFAERL